VTALLLADALNEKNVSSVSVAGSSESDETAAQAIEFLAERMEKLAAMLETGGPNA
jgi:hypothetical protein